jgi:ABC-type multidrug transport system fused ATPase/permease subunit
LNKRAAIAYVWSKQPVLLLVTAGTLLVGAIAEMSGLIIIAPIVSQIIDVSGAATTGVNEKITPLLDLLGLPIALEALFAVFVGITGVTALLGVANIYLLQKIKYRFCGELIFETLSKIYSAELSFSDSMTQGKLLNTFTKEIEVVGDLLATVGRFLTVLFQIAAFLVVPLVVSAKATLISVLVVFIAYIPLLLLGKISKKLGSVRTETANRFLTSLQEGLAALRLVIGFDSGKRTNEVIARQFRKHANSVVKGTLLDAGITQSTNIVAAIGVVTVFFAGNAMELPLADIAVIFVAFSRVAQKIGQIASLKSSLERGLPSLAQVLAIQKTAEKHRTPTEGRRFAILTDELALKDVSFSYSNTKLVLDRINLTVAKGSTIAIVGDSGAGKSTILDLLMGYYRPTSGIVAIDGLSLNKYNISEYRRRIGYVPQESFLFNATIEENIRWANPAATQDEIVVASELANARQFIEALPEKYNTHVGDRGMRLSGGQIQRIALARAFIRNPLILFLDEATSALDAHSEKAIQDALESIRGQMTTVIIAHRLSTIMKADIIYVIKNKKIAESGKYQDLIANRSTFWEMTQVHALIQH